MNSLVFVLLLTISSLLCNANSFNNPFAGNGCGGNSPLTRWARTGRSDTIQMSIDTSNCHFQDTPMYFTSIAGIAGHYLLVGVNAIYEPSKYGFVINVHSTTNATADALMAWSAQYNWSVNWFGFSA